MWLFIWCVHETISQVGNVEAYLLCTTLNKKAFVSMTDSKI